MNDATDEIQYLGRGLLGEVGLNDATLTFAGHSMLAQQLDISERQACRYVKANRRMIRYVRIPKDDAALRRRLEELAAERRRFGFRRLAVMLRREGGGRRVP